MSERSVDIEGLACYLILFLHGLELECSHVVQSVGNLDEDDSDVFRHGENEFSEVLGLHAGLFAEHASRYFGQSVHYAGYLLPEEVADIFGGVVGIFDHIVQQRGADGGGAQTYLFDHYSCHGERVHDIRFAATASDTLVCLLGEKVGFGYDVYLLAVSGLCIVCQERFELLLYELFFLLGKSGLVLFHSVLISKKYAVGYAEKSVVMSNEKHLCNLNRKSIIFFSYFKVGRAFC